MLRKMIRSYLSETPATAVSRDVARRLEPHRRERPDRPYCPIWQGDVMVRLLCEHGLRDCIETGFGTGSSALYMLAGSEQARGRVLSIDWSESNFNALGRALIAESGLSERHELIERPSHEVMAELLVEKRAFDFAFVDGWKTFDYLAYEVFILNRLLRDGGFVMFDDAYLPSVGKIVGLMTTHFGFREIRYRDYGETSRLRVWMAASHRRFSRPYRVLRKEVPVERQPATLDWLFFRKF